MTAVLLLPGGAAAAKGFFPGVEDALTEVIVHDRPGTGSAGPGRLEDAVEHLRQLLQARGGQPVVILSQSLGGALSMLFSAAHPDLVKGQVVVDPTPINLVSACRGLERVMTVVRTLTNLSGGQAATRA